MPVTPFAASPGMEISEALELDRRFFSTGSMGLTSGLVGVDEMTDSSVAMAVSWRAGMRERNLLVDGREDIFILGM